MTLRTHGSRKGKDLPVSKEMLGRLATIQETLESARTPQDLAKLMILFGEGIHAEFISGVDLLIRLPVVELHLRLTMAPWSVTVFSRIHS